MDDALAEFKRARELAAQRCLVVGSDAHVGDRQLDVVLAEAVEPRPFVGRDEFAVDAQMRVTLAARPFREIGVIAFACDDQRREQADAAAFVILQHARRDRFHRLRLDRDVALGTILRAELDEQQAQEMVDLGQRRNGALAAAAARALLDRDGRRDAENRVDVGLGRGLHELARVGV